eukprot:CAMPEP_0114305554 /NCGR_PEP_ID=MMETSP0059-20121206/16404_1 /TAXON_ID=36894 /ORGANISM="Pyramimonas parkeae, Strain CCMP726" /LENGTH=247 /DNA_ID=CAMNT_0001428771 /DNA_START=162 /DNA_END=906 /DNA_ORIENTATION=-
MAHSLELAATKLQLDIHPSKINNLLSGVREQLNQSLMRYNENFEAVVLAYFNETLVGSKAPILISLPYVSVDVKASLLLFRPIIDKPLEGVVNKVGMDHLGLLVNGAFNASIAMDDTDGAFQSQWSDQPEGAAGLVCATPTMHRIQEGSTVRFIVSARREIDQLMSLQGKMETRDTGNVEYLNNHGSDRRRRSKDSPRKKHKHIQDSAAEDSPRKSAKTKRKRDSLISDAEEAATPSSADRKKKRRK